MRKSPLLLLLAVAFTTIATAQNYWKKSKPNQDFEKTSTYQRAAFPKDFQLFTLDITEFSKALSTNARGIASTTLALPTATGKIANFKIRETSVFESGLAAKFPMIKSYSAQGIEDPTATAKISIGTDGAHIMVSSAHHETLFIDPYTKDNKTYMSYLRGNAPKTDNGFECQVEDLKDDAVKTGKLAGRNANDGKLRTFKIAIACTGEYAQFHLTQQGVAAGATDAVKKAAVLSAMNTTMTRVNQIYERDLATRMIIVNDNDKIIYLDAATDNLSNSSASALINESQTVCDAQIGSANYDIGHTFSTGGGGLAGLGVVCIAGQKGRGITGRSQPIGDPYDIDYVAHEIGHQFGATHTFNNACGGNRTGSTAVEPGSGSTIMAYAGICNPNVQSNSDDHFHAVSIKQMWDKIQSTANCAATSNTGNNAPTANAGSDVSIPKSTPFVLKAQATDADGTGSLTYNWEQTDTEIATMPPVAGSLGGPLFRSISSKSTPERYFPAFSTILAGNTSTTWEVLPSVARSMNFAVTVRDNHAGGGSTARDDIKITVVDAAPFTVNNQATWAQNTARDITWVVGQSNVAPINCQKVNIKLSVDGGTTFSVDLATNTANDGSENITLPASLADTDNAIIKIEAADNIFYNITSKFKISTSPDFAISNNTGDANVCNTKATEQSFEIKMVTSNGYAETVNYSVAGVPANATSAFTPTSLNAAGTTQLKLSNLDNVAAGDYTLTVTAKGTTITRTLQIKLGVSNALCASNGTTRYQTSTTYVKFNTIEKASPNKTAGYNDFKTLTTDVKRGETHQLTVRTNTDSGAQAYSTKTFAWIDWNQNCQFDAGEKLDLGTVTGGADTQTTLSPLNVVVPNDAELGSTVLRVSTKYTGDGDPSSCETNFDGEVEDYTVVVKDATASTEDVAFENFNLFPNPSNGTIKLSFAVKSNDKVSVQLFDIRGRLVERKEFTNTPSVFNKELTFDQVKSGMYLLQILNGGAQTTKKLMIN
jgi:hypothetical protein